MPRARDVLFAAFLASSIVTSACGKKESITPVGDGKLMTAEEIDKDPTALLPGGMAGLVRVDAKAFFASSTGPEAVRAASAYIPLTPEMNFDPKRDVNSYLAGIYSTTAADFVGVAEGKFDVKAVEAAVAKGAKTSKGTTITKVPYGGRDQYVAGDVSFVLLTEKVLLTGSPAGIRRALERMRDGRVKREVPEDMLTFVNTPGSHFGAVLDPKGQSIPQAAIASLPFLTGMKQAKVLGTFEGDAVRTGGQVVYSDEAAAKASKAKIDDMLGGWTMAIAGMAGLSPVRSMESRVQGDTVQFVAVLNGPAAVRFLEWARSAVEEKTKGAP